MQHIRVIFIITYFLLTVNFTNEKKNFSVKQYPLKNYQMKVVNSFNQKQSASLINAYITGNKRRLTKKQKMAHKYCNIQHFFTPSGIHVAPIFIIISVLIGKITFPSNVRFTLGITITTLTYIFSPFLSINRILVLKFFNRSKRLKIYFNGALPFYLTFIFDFIFGGYSKSPISFSLSFLFLGIIYFSKHFSKIHTVVLFFIGQIIISYFFNTNVTYLSFIFSPFLTVIFSTVFPILLILYFTPFLWWILEPIVYLLNQVILLCGELSVSSNSISPSLLIIVIVLILFFTKVKIISLPIIIAFLLSSKALYNLPGPALKKVVTPNIKKYGEVKSVKRTSRGYVVEYTNLTKCYPKLYNSGYFERCDY